MDVPTRTIGKAAFAAVGIMAASNLLSRLLGFVRMMVLANASGMSAHVDAYSYSFILPDIINHILAGSALSITFIPVFQDIIARKGEDASWRFFSNIFTVGTLLFAVVIAISIAATEQLLAFAGRNINSPDNPEQFALTVSLTRIIIPAQLFFFWGALLNGVQYAKKRFLLPALTPLLYNVGIITGGTLLFPFLNVAGFSWGVLGGAFLGNVVVQVPGALRAGMRFRPYIDCRDRDLLHWFAITIPLVLGLTMTFSNEVLFRAFGSGATDGAGAIASLDYSYKAMMFLVGIFGQSIAAGVYPFISQLAVDKKIDEMNLFIAGALTKVAALTIPVSTLFMLIAEPFIAVLYQRGQFDTQATIRTAGVFVCYLPGTFFISAGLVIVRAFYAMKNTVLPLVITTLSVAACLPVYYYLEKSMGARGIACASTITMAITFVLLVVFWNPAGNRAWLFSFIVSLGRILLYTLAGCVTGYVMLRLSVSYLSNSRFPFLKNLFVIFITCAPSLAVVGFLLDHSEIIPLRSMAAQGYHRLVRQFTHRPDA